MAVFQALVGRLGFLPAQAIWATAAALVLWLLLNQARFFSHVYYVGDNRAAARLMGIDVDGVIVATYMLHGLGLITGRPRGPGHEPRL
ncbi:MAG: hypothetical protein C4339_04545 [Nitrososphaerota archaeon]